MELRPPSFFIGSEIFFWVGKSFYSGKKLPVEREIWSAQFSVPRPAADLEKNGPRKKVEKMKNFQIFFFDPSRGKKVRRIRIFGSRASTGRPVACPAVFVGTGHFQIFFLCFREK